MQKYKRRLKRPLRIPGVRLLRAILWAIAFWLAALASGWIFDLPLWPASLLRIAAILSLIPMLGFGRS